MYGYVPDHSKELDPQNLQGIDDLVPNIPIYQSRVTFIQQPTSTTITQEFQEKNIYTLLMENLYHLDGFVGFGFDTNNKLVVT